MAILKDKTGRLNVFISISEIASDFMKLSGSLKARWPTIGCQVTRRRNGTSCSELVESASNEKTTKSVGSASTENDPGDSDARKSS